MARACGLTDVVLIEKQVSKFQRFRVSKFLHHPAFLVWIFETLRP
jgi:hypothetical protein